MSHFLELGVPQQLAAVLERRGITTPTPIQAATLPDSLAGRDVLGRGRTGSGKTFAFLLPLVARLVADGRRATGKHPRSLVLAPTRELALQIDDSLTGLAEATGLTHLTIFGGVNQNPQVRALARGVDVLVACPGRLLDLMGQGHVSLDAVGITVIDEADHMADMGFLPMVKKIMDATPTQGQRLLFSATLDNGIDVLVKRYLHQPVVHEADSAESPVATMDHHVLEVTAGERLDTIADLAAAPGRTILFTRTKYGAKKLAKQLLQRGIPALELHGNLAQNARTRNLDAFHTGRVQVLVATDIAARGIHVDDVELVVHADPPTEHKAYLHRSGRTARAGKEGTVVTMVLPEQGAEVKSLMRAAKIRPSTSGPDRDTLDRLAPGERVLLSPDEAERVSHPDKAGHVPVQSGAQAAPASGSGSGSGRGRRGGRGRGGSGASRGAAGSASGRGAAGGPSGRGQGGQRSTGGLSSSSGTAGSSTGSATRQSSGRSGRGRGGAAPAGSTRGAAALSKSMGGRRGR